MSWPHLSLPEILWLIVGIVLFLNGIFILSLMWAHSNRRVKKRRQKFEKNQQIANARDAQNMHYSPAFYPIVKDGVMINENY